MAGRDGIWSGMAAGAAVAALGLGALSLTAPQPAGNRPPEAPAVASPEVTPPDLADAANVAHGALATPGDGSRATAPVLRPLARPGRPSSLSPEGAGAGSAIDTASAALPEVQAPAAVLRLPDTGTPPFSPAGEAEAPTGAVAARPGAPSGGEVAAPSDAPPPDAPPPDASAGPPAEGGLPPPQAATVPPVAAGAAPDAVPSAVATPSDARPALVGRSGGAAPTAARDRRPGAEVVRSAAPLAVLGAPPGGLGKGLDAAPAEPGPVLSAGPARADSAPAGNAPARLVAPDDARARPADLAGALDVAPPAAPSRDAPPPDAAAPRAAPVPPAGPGEPTPITLGGGGLPGADATAQASRPAPATPAEQASAPSASLRTDAPALQRFAAPFAPPADGRPLLAVVLLDQGAADGPAAVAALPLPASVALDPSAPDAAERMAAYRARGIEVLAVARRPMGARSAEAGTHAEAMLAALPEAVAVLDLGEAGLEPGRATAGPALGRLADKGLGAVLAAETLGGAARVTAAGVPAAALLRDVDGAGQDASAVRRFLDDAARRAGGAEAGVVLARVRPETLEALALWVGGRRAGEVALAPVSAVLRAAGGAGPRP